MNIFKNQYKNVIKFIKITQPIDPLLQASPPPFHLSPLEPSQGRNSISSQVGKGVVAR